MISRSRPRRHRLATAAVGLALLAGACSTTTASDGGGSPDTARPAAEGGTTRPPRPTGTTSPAGSTGTSGSTGTGGAGGTTGRNGSAGTTGTPTAPLRWQDCGNAECATLAVPLDHDDPQGRTIDLAVARRPARDEANRVGSLLFNPGGPGASGVDFVRASGSFDDLNDRFDIVSWDPRGVGRSATVDCDDQAAPYEALDWSPDDAAERRALDTGAQAVADACAAPDAALLHHVSTDDTARDLDVLRAALGEDRLTYIGFSYGTLIGLRYAELFPGKVRAIALDGVVDPTNDLEKALEGQTRALDRTVGEMFAACDRSSSCAIRDAGATYDRVAARVEQQPIPAGSRSLGPTALAYAVIGSAYGEDASKTLLAGIAAADRGDGRPLLRLADGYFGSSSYGAYLATLCVDSPHPTGGSGYDGLEAQLTAVSPRFGAAIANEVRPCAFWTAPSTGDTQPVRAAGAAPILVVGNHGDFATPYESAARVADALDDGVLLSYDGTGHLSYGKSTCVDDAVNRYLLELALPDARTTCD